MKAIIRRVPAAYLWAVLFVSTATFVLVTLVMATAAEHLATENTVVKIEKSAAEKKAARLEAEKRQTEQALARANVKLRRAGVEPINPATPIEPEVALAGFSTGRAHRG